MANPVRGLSPLSDRIERLAAASSCSRSGSSKWMLICTLLVWLSSTMILGSDVADEILRLIRAAMVIEGAAGDWSGEPARADNMRVAVNAITAVLTGRPLELPPPEQRVEGLRTAKGLLLSSSKRRELPPEIMFSDLEELDWSKAAEEEHKTSKRRKAGT